jgi:hypothetical protein
MNGWAAYMLPPKPRAGKELAAQIISSVKTVHGFTYTICKPGIAANATQSADQQRLTSGFRLRTADPGENNE